MARPNKKDLISLKMEFKRGPREDIRPELIKKKPKKMKNQSLRRKEDDQGKYKFQDF